MRLAGGSVLADPGAYVAVSYCWNRQQDQWLVAHDGKGLQPIEMLKEGTSTSTSTSVSTSTRLSMMPPDVVHRAVDYAKKRNINAIWIDQECINQDNPTDKEDGIQAMDIVYQASDHPIAVLESCFETQAELDALASVVDSDRFEFDPAQIEALADILGALSADQWFERAWTLQESTSAGARMVLLIGVPENFTKPPCFGSLLWDFEISIQDFQDAMVNARILIERGLAAGVWADNTDSAIYASNWADELWNCIPTITPDRDLSRQQVSHRQECNAAQAVTFLDDRHNSVFPDRLAILANLCNYEHRINTKVLTQPGYSFSTCVLTLAVLNGDMSLLVGYGDADDAARKQIRDAIRAGDGRAWYPFIHYKNDDHDLPSNSYGFSWGPKPSGSLSDISYLEEGEARARLKPATLSAHGWRICGILWHVKSVISVPRTQIQFATKWEKELQLQAADEHFRAGLDRQRLLMQDFTWTLLRELVDQRLLSLAKTLWLFLQPLGKMTDGLGHFDSLTGPRPYSFDLVFGPAPPRIEESRTNPSLSTYDEQDVRNRLYTVNLSNDPTISALERSLIEQVCRSGTLSCGVPLNCSNDSEPRVWFQSSKEGDLLFTPFTTIGDGVIYSVYFTQAMSWKVRKARKLGDDNCEVLHCLGRRSGFWRLEGLEPRDYILE
jgi:hypothetical protein